MGDKNKNSLVIGLLFIFLAFLSAVVAIYFMGDTSFKKEQKIASLEVQVANLIAEKGQTALSAADAAKVKRQPITDEQYLEKAETLYGPQELDRRQGVLWIDRKGHKMMVTLGKVNGLQVNDHLVVYDNDTKIDEVVVVLPLDIVSYVQPLNKSMTPYTHNYYRVVNEALP